MPPTASTAKMAARTICRSCHVRLVFTAGRPAPESLSRARLVRAASTGSAPGTPRVQGRPARATPPPSRHFHQALPRSGVVQKVVDTISPRTSQTYMLFGATKQIYNVCAKQAAYQISAQARRDGSLQHAADGEEIGIGEGVWHKDFALLPTFSTWAQVTMLHLYLLLVRIRCLDKADFKLWEGQLTDHFFHDAEERMDLQHSISSRALRQRYLKELFLQWRGAILAYDEGLIKGDAVLASAVWRNLFKGKEDVDARQLAAVVGWMRMVLKSLDGMLDPALAFHAAGAFATPPTALLNDVDEPAVELRDVPESAAMPKLSPSAV